MSEFNRVLSKALLHAGRLCLSISRKMYRSSREAIIAKWVRDRGDTTLRLNYDLDEDSLVLDIGGYKGQWASDIFSMYLCTVHVFEPISEFAEDIVKRFSRNPRIIVHKIGLSNETRKTMISCEEDGSSTLRRGARAEEILLVRASDFLQGKGIRSVDLMKINIEGAEYDLLEHLLAVGFVRHCRNIQVQFHDFVPDASLRMENIQRQLARTHFLTYQYPFAWENWRLRDD